MKFEIVSKYANAGLSLPVRKTKASAGYDFQVAMDTIIPSYYGLCNELAAAQITTEYCDDEILTLDKVAFLTKYAGCKPILVPTGIKCEMPEDMYLELSVRSSCPLKHWLILANGVGIIDSDYYNNPDNEGHIFFQIINLSPFDILLKKGDAIGQGIFKKYYLTDDDAATAERQGGFGSTDSWVKATMSHIPESVVDAFNETGHSHILTTDEWYKLGMEIFSPKESKEEECVMACNPERRAFIVGAPKNPPAENHNA